MNLLLLVQRVTPFFFSLFMSIPLLAQAHEVYVLSPEEVAQGLTEPSLDVFGIASTHFGQFSFWAFITAVVVAGIFLFSVSRKVEQVIDPIFFKIKRYAPLVVRLTVGLGFIAAAYHGAFLAPEMPLGELGEMDMTTAGFLLGAAGALLVLGFAVRLAALVGLGFFILAFARYGTYPLIYMDYLSALVFLFMVGGHDFSLERHLPHVLPRVLRTAKDHLYHLGVEYGLTIVRVGFGFSLTYASFYGKYLYSGLAFETVKSFNLAIVFGFEPGFLVLGAFLLEVLLGVFFILGIEIRFAVIFAAVFLTLSQLYFMEAVWPHTVLFGLAIAIFMHGYDKYSLEGRFFKKPGREPVL